MTNLEKMREIKETIVELKKYKSEDRARFCNEINFFVREKKNFRHIFYIIQQDKEKLKTEEEVKLSLFYKAITIAKKLAEILANEADKDKQINYYTDFYKRTSLSSFQTLSNFVNQLYHPELFPDKLRADESIIEKVNSKIDHFLAPMNFNIFCQLYGFLTLEEKESQKTIGGIIS